MLQIFSRKQKLMGNAFEISVVGEDEEISNQQIDAAIVEIQRIETLLSTYQDDSDTNRINQSAGIEPVPVQAETFDLIYRSLKISHLTQGAFDISYGSIDKKLWNFDKTMTTLPDAETAKKSVHLINYKNILLNKEAQTVLLKYKGMRIGFGGIGKGYAADKARMLLQELGGESGIVNASGDLAIWGQQPDGKPWTVGIADPNNAHKVFSYLEISDMAVATSGNYEKFVLIDGKKYSHTINPKTGLPVRGIKSVTIFSPAAEVADAMATPVTIMGIRAGLNLINQLKGIECIIIDDNDAIYCSKNINLHK